MESLSATVTVPAPPEEVFAVVADPDTHADVSGGSGSATSARTGWVNGAVDHAPLTAAGQVFRMRMYHPDHPDGDYVTANQVRVLDPPRAISWATGTEDADGVLSFGGWWWRYDLAAVDGGTALTLTYDWSEATPDARRVIGFPPFGVEHLERSLDRLAELVTG